VRTAPWLAIPVAFALFHAAPAAGEDVRRARDILVEGRTLEPAEIFEDTPTETEVLTREDVQKRPATNAAEVVRKLPGIRTQRRVQGEEAAVSVEGLPANYTKILVDGERYTGEVGGVQDLRDLPIGDVERIEILRGTQGLRYGTEAGGAVINLITRGAPRDGWRAHVSGGGGDDVKVLGNAAVGMGNDWLGASLSFDHDQIDGFDAPPGLDDAVITGGNTASRRLSRDVYGTLRYEPIPSLRLKTRLGWREEVSDLAFDEQDDTERRRFERWTLTQEAEWLAGETTRVLGSIHWYDGVTDSTVGREVVIDDQEVKLYTAGELFLETGPVTHVLTAGVDARFDQLDLEEAELAPSLRTFGVDQAPSGGSVSEDLQKAGFFLIGESELSRWASLEWGARAQLHSRFDTEVVPQAALLLRPHETLKLRFSVGRNTFAPSLRDLFQPPVPNVGGSYFLAGNPDLVPETSTSWRAGVEWTPRTWLSFSTVGFWNDIEDHIRSTQPEEGGLVTVGFEERLVTVPDDIRPGLAFICREVAPPPPVCDALTSGKPQTVLTPDTRTLFRKTNLDTVTTRGFETRMELRPHRRFELQLGYTWLDTEVIDSNLQDLDQLPNEPHHTVDALTRVTAPWIETDFTLQARWRGRAVIETSGTGLLSFAQFEKSDDSLFLDLRVSRPVPGLAAEIYADFRNLTNQRVEDSNVVRGRTWFLGFRMRFGGERS